MRGPCHLWKIHAPRIAEAALGSARYRSTEQRLRKRRRASSERCPTSGQGYRDCHETQADRDRSCGGSDVEWRAASASHRIRDSTSASRTRRSTSQRRRLGSRARQGLPRRGGDHHRLNATSRHGSPQTSSCREPLLRRRAALGTRAGASFRSETTGEAPGGAESCGAPRDAHGNHGESSVAVKSYNPSRLEDRPSTNT